MNDVRQRAADRLAKMAGPGCFFEFQTPDQATINECTRLIYEDAAKLGITVEAEEIRELPGRLLVSQV